MEIRGVVGSGPGWTQVRDAYGNTYTVSGDRNWRNNNPGNLEYGDFARSHGAIGTDGRFAVFPSYDAGRAAKSSLLFGSPSYASRTLASAISRYAPSWENNTKGYTNRVARDIGVHPNTRLSDLTPSQRERMLDSMQKVEGFRSGKAKDAFGKSVNWGPDARGIMSAIDPSSVPTPTARPDMAFSAPRTAIERAPLAKEVPMASFDMGRFGPATTTAFDASRFGPTPTTPTAFDMQRFGPVEAAAPGMEGLRQGLLAQQTAMGVAPYADPAVSRQVAQPSVQVSQPVDMTRTGATGMRTTAAPTISQAQRDIAAKTQKDMQTRSLLGTVGSAILGGALLGPVGGLLGGYVGKSLANANYFPDAPEKLNPSSSNDRGYGGLNDYGRSAYNESRDFRDAVDKGSAGLW